MEVGMKNGTGIFKAEKIIAIIQQILPHKIHFERELRKGTENKEHYPLVQSAIDQYPDVCVVKDTV